VADEAPQPGVAGMSQGQTSVEPEEADTKGGLPEDGVGVPPEDQPEQPDLLVTGGEALEEQQQNPDLDDNTGARP
jgi:hypothetical protein